MEDVLDIQEDGKCVIARIKIGKILYAADIARLGDELLKLTERYGASLYILNFAAVEFLSIAALNKVIVFERKIEEKDGILVICSLIDAIYEVFALTRLNQLFRIVPGPEDVATVVPTAWLERHSVAL